jgi:CubicO group peptidase (beta-lactamase class C family)
MKTFTFLILATLTPLTLAGCVVAPAAVPEPTPTPAPLPTPPPTFWPTEGWKTSTPEQQGLSAATLAKIFERIGQEHLKVHSLLIIRHGSLVSETYFEDFQADTQHEVFSCTKSVISALVGIAIQQGYIDSVQHPVLDYFPERTIAHNDARKQAMTLEHLLTMTSGLESDRDMGHSQDWVQFMLDQPMVAEPGVKFDYNSGNTHLLSAILQKTTGMRPEEFAQANLFAPLGITHVTWDTDPSGLNIGGWGLRMTPRDMAKFGYLYLHGGEWNGQQVVPANWVKMATQRHIDTDDGRGYGYAWWQLSFGGYAALGYGGQQILVFPERDMIVVFTSQSYPPEDEKQLWRLVDEFIIPAQID